MQWFRSRAKRTSGLALFALAIQFALSFGHFHPAEFARSTTEVASAYKATIVAAVASSDQNSVDHDAGYCGVCAVTALAKSTVLAAAGGLPLPDLVGAVLLRSGTPFRLIETKRVAFQSRAPPALS